MGKILVFILLQIQSKFLGYIFCKIFGKILEFFWDQIFRNFFDQISQDYMSTYEVKIIAKTYSRKFSGKHVEHLYDQILNQIGQI